MCVAWKICIIGAISLNKIFIKICSHPIISWFFVTTTISCEKILWPPAFSWPPYLEENDTPKLTWFSAVFIDNQCTYTSYWLTRQYDTMPAAHTTIIQCCAVHIPRKQLRSLPLFKYILQHFFLHVHVCMYVSSISSIQSANLNHNIIILCTCNRNSWDYFSNNFYKSSNSCFLILILVYQN